MAQRNFTVFSVTVLLSLLIFQFISKTPVEFTDDAVLPETFTIPLGLQPIPWPEDNPYTKEKAELGRLLYFDKRLSANNTISCAHCHNETCGFSDCRRVAVGIDDKVGNRHSPSVINAAYTPHLFWDGRADSLEEQCKGPLSNPKEMSGVADPHVAHQQCVDRIAAIEGYRVLFKNVFGKDEITMDDISKAIATFERTILSGNSPYDKYMAGDQTALTPEQIQGLQVFKKSGCAFCHSGFNFTDNQFHNIGVGMDAANPDTGRYHVTNKDSDWGAFKTPTLRDVERNAPYMHDGSSATLEDVIEFYNKGGIPNKNLHRRMKPLNLSPQDKANLLDFLKALNGEGWQHFQEPSQLPK